MRICFIGDPSSIHFRRWVDWFATRHQVGVISTAASDQLDDHCLATLPMRSLPGARLVASALQVRRIISRWQPDVVHCHYINEAGWLGAAAGFHPLVITAWGSDIYRAPRESRLARRLNPWAVRAADFVTCDSAHQVMMLRGWGVSPAKLAMIGWGVDRDEFRPGTDGRALRDALKIPVAGQVLLSPRQWIANSNVPAIVAAHSRLADDVYLILKYAGNSEPDTEAEVREAVERSPARDRIRLLGEIASASLPALYAAADVVISLCSTDGTPASVLEAMAVGRPVVALANPSLAEWVGPPGGQLVASLEPDAIAQAIRTFLLDPEQVSLAAAHNVGVIAAAADRQEQFARMDGIYHRLAGAEAP